MSTYHNGIVSESAVDSDTIILKSVTETVNNSSVLQNDDELVLPVAANEIWRIFMLILYTSNTTADFKMAFTAPAGGDFNYTTTNHIGALLVPGTTQEGFTNLTTANTLAFNGGTNIGIIIMGLYIGGANAGNLQLQWAQNTAGVSDTQVLQNSYIVAQKLN